MFKISAISLGIGSVLLGITVDYSLHLFTHYRTIGDVKKVLKDINSNAAIKVYYSSEYRLDKTHAEQLKGINNVELIEMGEGDHEIVKVLRDNGELIQIITKSLQY